MLALPCHHALGCSCLAAFQCQTTTAREDIALTPASPTHCFPILHQALKPLSHSVQGYPRCLGAHALPPTLPPSGLPHWQLCSAKAKALYRRSRHPANVLCSSKAGVRRRPCPALGDAAAVPAVAAGPPDQQAIQPARITPRLASCCGVCAQGPRAQGCTFSTPTSQPRIQCCVGE